MELHELIPKDKIFIFERSPGDKMEMMNSLLDMCVQSSGIDSKFRDPIWKTLFEREMSMSTGIGLGVAIPHCSTEHVQDVKGVLALLKEGVDFQSVDDEPVRIIVLLLLPKNKFEKHIKTLASIARMFNDESFRKSILKARTAEEAWKILQEESRNKS